MNQENKIKLAQTSIHHASIENGSSLGEIEQSIKTNLEFREVAVEINAGYKEAYEAHFEISISNHINVGERANTSGYKIKFCLTGIFLIQDECSKETIQKYFTYNAINDLLPYARQHIESFRHLMGFHDDQNLPHKVNKTFINRLIEAQNIALPFERA